MQHLKNSEGLVQIFLDFIGGEGNIFAIYGWVV